jgi:dephospho-CoA kinase
MTTLRHHSHIALAGKACAGKSELARFLHDTYHYKHLSTGGLCRKVASLLQIDSDRLFLDKIGEALRLVDENIWVRELAQQAMSEGFAVVDSVRYKSEALLLRSLGFEIWRVQVDEPLRQRRLEGRGNVDAAGLAQLASEIELDVFPNDFLYDSTEHSFAAIEVKLGPYR